MPRHFPAPARAAMLEAVQKQLLQQWAPNAQAGSARIVSILPLTKLMLEKVLDLNRTKPMVEKVLDLNRTKPMVEKVVLDLNRTKLMLEKVLDLNVVRGRNRR